MGDGDQLYLHRDKLKVVIYDKIGKENKTYNIPSF